MAWGRGAAAGPHPRADALPRALRPAGDCGLEVRGCSARLGGRARRWAASQRREDPGAGRAGRSRGGRTAFVRWPRQDGRATMAAGGPAAASVRLRGQMQRPLAPGPLADEGWPPFASRVMMMMGGDGKTVSRPPARPSECLGWPSPEGILLLPLERSARILLYC